MAPDWLNGPIKRAKSAWPPPGSNERRVGRLDAAATAPATVLGPEEMRNDRHNDSLLSGSGTETGPGVRCWKGFQMAVSAY